MIDIKKLMVPQAFGVAMFLMAPGGAQAGDYGRHGHGFHLAVGDYTPHAHLPYAGRHSHGPFTKYHTHSAPRYGHHVHRQQPAYHTHVRTVRHVVRTTHAHY